jgi:hypothetical protein
VGGGIRVVGAPMSSGIALARAVINRRYREKHRAELTASQRKKYKRNRDLQLQTQRAYRAERREELRARARQYYYDHRDAILAKKAAERRHERAGRPERTTHQRQQVYGQELVRVAVPGWGVLCVKN